MIKTEPNVEASATTSSVSRAKIIGVFVLTIVLGYALFIAPNLFFGISKVNGGLQGINLLLMALFQCVSVVGLIYYSLRALRKGFQDIGWSFANWRSDGLLGLIVGGGWAVLQLAIIIPATGGAERADVAQMIDTMDGTAVGLLSYLALGVIGGGITEEIFNRGFSINVLRTTFRSPRVGVWVASGISVLLFALAHMPTDLLSWFDILVPTIAYTLLFLHTQRLTASIVAHSVYNAVAILSIYFMYYL
jgi:membrane protease YdiL (CAAX protease family)